MEYQLHQRLVHCIQTILELEPQVNTLHAGAFFHTEMMALRDCLGRVDGMDLIEADVLRFERATEFFLDEIRLPLAGQPYQPGQCVPVHRVLQ